MKTRNISLLIGLALILQACQTPNASPETIAYRTIGTITTSVDTARKAWNDYVRNVNNKVTVSQVKSVADAYDKYQKSVEVARAAIPAYKANPDAKALDITIAIVQSSANDTINLVNSFTVKH